MGSGLRTPSGYESSAARNRPSIPACWSAGHRTSHGSVFEASRRHIPSWCKARSAAAAAGSTGFSRSWWSIRSSEIVPPLCDRSRCRRWLCVAVRRCDVLLRVYLLGDGHELGVDATECPLLGLLPVRIMPLEEHAGPDMIHGNYQPSTTTTVPVCYFSGLLSAGWV